jgi:hypothetical protein
MRVLESNFITSNSLLNQTFGPPDELGRQAQPLDPMDTQLRTRASVVSYHAPRVRSSRARSALLLPRTWDGVHASIGVLPAAAHNLPISLRRAVVHRVMNVNSESVDALE